GALGVAAHEGVHAPAQHGAGKLVHARDVDQGLERRLVAYDDADGGDALRVVAHALQVGDDVEHGGDDPQVGGYGLLGGYQQQTVLLDAKALLVYLEIVVNDLLRLLDIAR